MSALAGTISAPLARPGGIDVGRLLRPLLSLLTAVAILAVALPAAFGSGTSTTGVDPVQVFSSSKLLTETSGGTQLSIAGMVPGQSKTATIRVSNAGSGAAALSLSVQTADQIRVGGTPLSAVLNLRVEGVAGEGVLYDGPIGQMPRLALGAATAGAEERAYRFTVALPQRVGNEIEGSSLSAGFAWNLG